MTRGVRLFVAVGCLVLASGVGRSGAGEVDLPRLPSLSPDGRQVVFSWRGDLWRAGTEGGAAVRLTAHPADELASAWSPDGVWIAFESERSGRRAVHVMRPDGTDVRQVTIDDASVSLSGFSADGRHILVSAAVEGDTYRSSRPYRVAFEGGPLVRLHDAFGQEAGANPKNGSYAFERGGTSLTRRHYRGADNKDLFLFNGKDGSFERLTDWAGHDAYPKWRNEDTLLFLSDRGPGEQNTVGLWAMEVGKDTEALRLTDFEDRDISSFDVSADGRTVALVKWDGLYIARFKGKRLDAPKRLTITAPADAFPKRETRDVSSDADEAVLSPDGKVMAFVAFGDVFVRAVEEGSPTRRVTEGAAREKDIAWSPDMSRLYFVSDREGTDSIYAATVSLTRGELRDRFGEATKVEPEVEEPKAEEQSENEGEQESEETKQDDGDGAAAEAAATPAAKTARDEKKDRPKVAERWHDAMRFEIHPIVVAQTEDRRPTPSPDGLKLAFARTLGDLVLRDLRTGEERVMLESWDFRQDFRWSPTGEAIAYSVNDEDFNADVFVIPVDGSWEPVNITKHPGNDVSPRWSDDGKILAFLSEREGSGADMDVFAVMLDRDLEAKTSQEMEAYFKARNDAVKKLGVIDPIDWDAETTDEAASDDKVGDEKKADEKKAAEPAFTPEDLEDAYRRLRRVTRYLGGEGNLEITPSGDRVIFRALGGAGGTSGVYSTKVDGSDEKRLATSGSVQHVSRDGSRVVMLSSGRAVMVPPSGGTETRVGVTHTVEIDHEALSLQKFREMARTLGRTFYHPTMKDLDWEGLTEEYAELAARAWTSDEFAEIGMRLMGELSASHLGVTPPSDYSNPDFRSSGRLGIDATPLEDGSWRVDKVLPRLRTNSGQMRLRVGDVITGIELEALKPGESLDQRLQARTGEETIVTVRRVIGGGDGEAAVERSLDLLVTPVSLGDERAMRYDDWQLANAAKVAEWSDGRIGYLHIRSMGAPDLVEYERDLFEAAYRKEGLIIDVRSNGGGWTTDRVLASLMYPFHAYTLARGADPERHKGYPRDRLFIQRFNGPVNMLCNEKSFSNAEIISHAFKTLRRGTLVGMPTHGSVISTGAFTLVDGTRVRQPFRGWFLPDGTDMENNGAVPDIIVEQTPRDEADGFDRQLKAAVEDLMKRLD